jgi:hypothetical protein
VDLAAMNEHSTMATWRSPLSVIRAEYGRGVMAYFAFLQYTLAVQLVLSVVAVALFGVAWSGVRLKLSVSAAFVALWPAAVRTGWLASVAIMLGVAFVAALAWPLVHARFVAHSVGGSGGGRAHKSILSSWGRGSGGGAGDAHDDGAADGEMDGAPESRGEDMASASDMREDIASRAVTVKERRWRQLLSALAFFGLIAGQSVVTYGIFVGLASNNAPVLSFVVSFANNALNFLGKLACKSLTVFERHATVSRRGRGGWGEG